MRCRSKLAGGTHFSETLLSRLEGGYRGTGYREGDRYRWYSHWGYHYRYRWCLYSPTSPPVTAPVLEALVVVELVEPLPGLHEGELPAEADLLLLPGPVKGARRPVTGASEQV